MNISCLPVVKLCVNLLLSLVISVLLAKLPSFQTSLGYSYT